MEAWVPITLAAAFFQNLRSAVQRHLKDRVGTAGATLSRFLFAAPFAILYALSMVLLREGQVPHLGSLFFLYASVGGIAQILATALLITAVSEGNFAVGTALSKTETIQTVVFAAVLLGEWSGPFTLLGIVLSLMGALLLVGPLGAARKASLRPVLAGIASGSLFAISAVCYRGAALSLAPVDGFTAAAVTLACVTTFQTIVTVTWMLRGSTGALIDTLKAWRWAAAAGAAGMLASVGWFTAMALQPVPSVRALGQVELLFSLAASKWAFKEPIRPRELLGVVLLGVGIITVVLRRG